MKLALVFTVLAGLIGVDAQAAALFKMKTRFASMDQKEIVVQSAKGKRFRLKKDMIKKSDIELLTKKSNGKFVAITVPSNAIIVGKAKQ